MALLIDCYNLLHGEMPPNLAGLEEERLCELLADSLWARRPIVVVCDGSVKPGGLSSSPFAEVSLVYSGRGKSADQIIMNYVDRSHTPRQMTVVTDDREIQKAVRTRKAKVMPVERFIAALSTLARRAGTGQSALAGSAKPEAGDMSDEEVSRWMDTFGFDGDVDLPADDFTAMLKQWEEELE